MRVSFLSLTSVPLSFYFNDILLATGTGFFLNKDEESYLITAWHNLSGRNRWTGKCMHKQGGIPNRVVIHGFVIAPTGTSIKHFLGNAYALSQYILDESGAPLWFVHSKPEMGCDVAVLPLKISDDAINNGLRILFPTQNETSDMQLDAGSNLFIIGYPFGIEPFPIWKRATVASEPMLMNKMPMPFLSVDTSTRQGLSGSPVFSYETSGYRSNNGDVFMTARPHHKYIGIYTGRRPVSSGDDAHIGIVWPREMIDAIFVDGIKDKHDTEYQKLEFPSYEQ